jgi:lipid-binding SYLF domain-containing protein
MKKILVAMALSLSLVALCAGCLHKGWNPSAPEPQKSQNHGEAAEALASFRTHDPGMKTFFERAYGYAVFPTVGKGGMGVGGAYGKGEVYERGVRIGTSSLTQLTIGWQLGGQAYSEIIFFKNRKALSDFKKGNFELGAQASAVAVTAGASADASFDKGVAVFTLAKGGLMYEASIGGQKFSFDPK